MEKLSHVDNTGKASMVDISNKDITDRYAKASGIIKVSPEVLKAIEENNVKKGDVLSTARIAGIMAAKNTANIIPLCHTLLLSRISIDFEVNKTESYIKCYCEIKMQGKTGAEMEALTGVSTALLTVYDMCKAIDKTMVISDVLLEEKDGGKSGHYIAK